MGLTNQWVFHYQASSPSSRWFSVIRAVLHQWLSTIEWWFSIFGMFLHLQTGSPSWGLFSIIKTVLYHLTGSPSTDGFSIIRPPEMVLYNQNSSPSWGLFSVIGVVLHQWFSSIRVVLRLESGSPSAEPTEALLHCSVQRTFKWSLWCHNISTSGASTHVHHVPCTSGCIKMKVAWNCV